MLNYGQTSELDAKKEGCQDAGVRPFANWTKQAGWIRAGGVVRA